jgi:hypothetical protein
MMRLPKSDDRFFPIGAFKIKPRKFIKYNTNIIKLTWQEVSKHLLK